MSLPLPFRKLSVHFGEKLGRQGLPRRFQDYVDHKIWLRVHRAVIHRMRMNLRVHTSAEQINIATAGATAHRGAVHSRTSAKADLEDKIVMVPNCREDWMINPKTQHFVADRTVSIGLGNGAN
jgi:hypothetical protein